MDITGPMWATGDERGARARLAAALTFSLLCHLLLVLAAGRGSEAGPFPTAPIVVTMVESGGGGDGGTRAAGDASTAAAPRPPAPAAEPAPLVQPPALGPARRAALTTRPPPVARARAETGSPGRAPVADTDGGGAASGAGDLAALGAGSGTGGGSAGTGVGSLGSGAGGDGLRAFCRSCPPPDYPPRARRQGWQGTVDVALRIGLDGVVEAAAVERSSGYAALDEVALASARASRFTVPDGGPGLRGQLRYRFVLDATAAGH